MDEIDNILQQADSERARGNSDAADALLRHAQTLTLNARKHPDIDTNVIALQQETEHLKNTIAALVVAGLLACIFAMLLWSGIQMLSH